MTGKKLIKAKEYAEQENINLPAVYKRIKKGYIKSVKKNNLTYVEVLDHNVEQELTNKNKNVLEFELLQKRIIELEKDKQREIERGNRLEQDLREKDQLIKAVLQSNHTEMLTALKNIGASQISKIGMQRQMGHFDEIKHNPSEQEVRKNTIEKKQTKKKGKKKR